MLKIKLLNWLVSEAERQLVDLCPLRFMFTDDLPGFMVSTAQPVTRPRTGRLQEPLCPNGNIHQLVRVNFHSERLRLLAVAFDGGLSISIR